MLHLLSACSILKLDIIIGGLLRQLFNNLLGLVAELPRLHLLPLVVLVLVQRLSADPPRLLFFYHKLRVLVIMAGSMAMVVFQFEHVVLRAVAATDFLRVRVFFQTHVRDALQVQLLPWILIENALI